MTIKRKSVCRSVKTQRARGSIDGWYTLVNSARVSVRSFTVMCPTIEPKLGQQAVGVPQTPFRRVPGPPVRHGVDTVKLRTSQGTRNGLRLGRDTFTRAQIRHVKPRTSDSPVVALVRRRRRR
jgi:hypothetical protein